MITIAAGTCLPFVPHLPFAGYLYSPVEYGVIILAAVSIAIMLPREYDSGRGQSSS
jgi:hypothetical protein